MAKTETAAALIRCACGAIEGRVDERGGTDVVATVPRHVRFTRGLDRLQCMSLSPAGLLRWHCRECRTPIANTPRNPRLSYVGVVRACLAGSADEIDALFGPASLAINTRSATAPVRSGGFAMIASTFRILRNVLGARWSGGWRTNPFFRDGTDAPIATPVLADAR